MSEERAYEWTRIGGHLALDLCNTVSWRLDPARTIERLPDAPRLVDWFCAVTGQDVQGVLSADLAARPRLARQALQTVWELRGASSRLLDCRFDRSPGRAEDAAAVGQAWRKALEVADLAPSLPLTPSVVPTTLPLVSSYLALSVADFLRGRELSGLGRCAGEGCGWFFLDTTRNHSRRWCDSSDCGNRARVRRYVERRRSG